MRRSYGERCRSQRSQGYLDASSKPLILCRKAPRRDVGNELVPDRADLRKVQVLRSRPTHEYPFAYQERFGRGRFGEGRFGKGDSGRFGTPTRQGQFGTRAIRKGNSGEGQFGTPTRQRCRFMAVRTPAIRDTHETRLAIHGCPGLRVGPGLRVVRVCGSAVACRGSRATARTGSTLAAARRARCARCASRGDSMRSTARRARYALLVDEPTTNVDAVLTNC